MKNTETVILTIHHLCNRGNRDLALYRMRDLSLSLTHTTVNYCNRANPNYSATSLKWLKLWNDMVNSQCPLNFIRIAFWNNWKCRWPIILQLLIWFIQNLSFLVVISLSIELVWYYTVNRAMPKYLQWLRVSRFIVGCNLRSELNTYVDCFFYGLFDVWWLNENFKIMICYFYSRIYAGMIL